MLIEFLTEFVIAIGVVLLLLFSAMLFFQPKLDLPDWHWLPFWGPYLTLLVQSNLQHIWDCHDSFPLWDDIYSVKVLLALQKQVCMSSEYASTSCCVHCSKHTDILQVLFLLKSLLLSENITEHYITLWLMVPSFTPNKFPPSHFVWQKELEYLIDSFLFSPCKPQIFTIAITFLVTFRISVASPAAYRKRAVIKEIKIFFMKLQHFVFWKATIKFFPLSLPAFF